MATAPSVLIVDQDPEARYGVRRLVEEAGFVPAAEAGLGTEAVAEASDLKPDLVLFGFKEPIVRAVQTVEAIVYDLPDTPVIAYADSAELQTVRQAMAAGARDFLQAPLKIEELARALTSALESVERRKLRGNGSAASLGPRGAVVTVFGAKGGAGKTTVATNLAVALAARGDQSVLLIDADDSFGDAAAGLGLAQGTSVVDALREPSQLDATSLQRHISRHRSGVAVLQGPSSPFEWRDVAGERLYDAIGELSRQYEVVVVDTASTSSDVSVAALRAASLVLWITTPDYASAHDSVRALHLLSSVPVDEDRVRLVMNMNTPELDVTPSSLETALGRPIFWSLPYDRELRRGAQLGRSVVEIDGHSEAAVSFADLAAVLSGASPGPRSNGLLSRWLNGSQPGTSVASKEARA